MSRPGKRWSSRPERMTVACQKTVSDYRPFFVVVMQKSQVLRQLKDAIILAASVMHISDATRKRNGGVKRVAPPRTLNAGNAAFP